MLPETVHSIREEGDIALGSNSNPEQPVANTFEGFVSRIDECRKIRECAFSEKGPAGIYNRIVPAEMLPDETEAVPVEFQGEYSTAMGFIDIETADRMYYIYTELEKYVKEILDDMELESPDGKYMFAHENETVSLLIRR